MKRSAEEALGNERATSLAKKPIYDLDAFSPAPALKTTVHATPVGTRPSFALGDELMTPVQPHTIVTSKTAQEPMASPPLSSLAATPGSALNATVTSEAEGLETTPASKGHSDQYEKVKRAVAASTIVPTIQSPIIQRMIAKKVGVKRGEDPTREAMRILTQYTQCDKCEAYHLLSTPTCNKGINDGALFQMPYIEMPEDMCDEFTGPDRPLFSYRDICCLLKTSGKLAVRVDILYISFNVSRLLLRFGL
jgi:hypothetical protein